MNIIKKIIKFFIPHGIYYLIKERKKNIKYHTIIKDTSDNPLIFCNLSIERSSTKDNIIKINREDYNHPIYLRNSTSDIYVYRDIIEQYEYSFSTSTEPKYIIDAGANIGIASIFFATKYKNAKVIAIEPEQKNFEMLKVNTENYPNIVAVNAALWNNNGEISLVDVGLDNWGFMVESGNSESKFIKKDVKYLVKAITVDQIMQDFKIDYIDILKIDIEGAEKEVFEQCGNWIHKTRSIIIELHERMKQGCNKSFYKHIKLFDQIGKRSEDIYLSLNNYIEME